MKTIKQFLLLGFLLLSVAGTAQNAAYLPDEIWYDTGKNIYIQFNLPSVYKLNQYTDASKTFGVLFTRNLSEQIRNSEKSKKVNIKLDEQNDEFGVQFENEHNNEYFLPAGLSSDSTINFQKLNVLTKEGAKINCYFEKFDDLMLFLKNDWDSKIGALSAKINKKSSGYERKAVSVLYKESDGEIQEINKTWNPKVNNLDQLQLTGSAGINLFKNSFLPSFKFHLGLVFSQKGIYKHHYFVEYELMYDFASENDQLLGHTGHFIDFGYMYNFSKNQDKADWYGVSAGYLVHKKSDVFDDHTWRISVRRNITKNIELIPQIYFPNDFSKIFPGVGLNVNF
ncbi:MAG: hypothetical protein WC384_05270 [Prolixibacteraceae bacterium]|jgi:hypothetical protein